MRSDSTEVVIRRCPVFAQLLAVAAGVDGGMKAPHPAVFQMMRKVVPVRVP